MKQKKVWFWLALIFLIAAIVFLIYLFVINPDKKAINCIGEGNTIRDNIECCLGLKPINQYTPEGVIIYNTKFCTDCGDGICRTPENKYSCPVDCGEKASEYTCPSLALGQYLNCMPSPDSLARGQYCKWVSENCPQIEIAW